MSYLFIKNLFQREKFVLFSSKIKNQKNKPKKPKKKTFLVGFLGVFFWVFLGGFFIANPAIRTRSFSPARASRSSSRCPALSPTSWPPCTRTGSRRRSCPSLWARRRSGTSWRCPSRFPRRASTGWTSIRGRCRLVVRRRDPRHRHPMRMRSICWPTAASISSTPQGRIVIDNLSNCTFQTAYLLFKYCRTMYSIAQLLPLCTHNSSSGFWVRIGTKMFIS